MATPSARAWSSAEVGEMKWTWQSTAIQSAPAGPTDRLERQDERGAATVAVDVERSGERAIAEPADHLDLHGPVRQLDGEPARDVGVGRAAEDEVRAGVLVEARVDLVAMPERREVPPVGRPEPDPGGHRLAGRRVDDLDLDPTRRRPKRLDGHGAEPLARAVGRQAARRHEILADGDRGVRRSSRGRRASRSPGASAASGSPQPATALDAPTGRLEGRRRRALPEHLPEVDGHGTGRAARALDPQRPAWLEDQRRGRPAERRDRRDHDPAPRVERRERLHPQSGDVSGAIRDLDRVQPQRDVAGRAGHRIGHPGLGGTPAARAGSRAARRVPGSA